jgi:signal transduction histidine kinase
MNETREQVSRLQKLATDLLDLSRLDAGRLAVARESFDLGAVGELLAIEFGPRAAAVDHGLALDLRGAVAALGDEERTLQVGRLLVENALVHTPAGTIVTVVVESDNKGEARLSVVDDGPGIPPEAQPHVFDRFFRLDGTVAAGSGLGLAIAREVAELMDGRVELRSAPGATSFTLVLPVDAFGHTLGAGMREVDGRPERVPRRIAQV